MFVHPSCIPSLPLNVNYHNSLVNYYHELYTPKLPYCHALGNQSASNQL